ncbi:MAG: creatininase family protein [Anaerolineae bacterium]|jgi:creatinine amidohydrolase|nr:creatininase family protein [Anaerolineae bacterium]MBT7073908.1 creatininase family protein [Anaerolineae bacterium]MBT7782701.1 creatininase family protein [Anaerolineae bacterium]
MRFEELNWMDIESYLEKDDRLMIVLGATEQHAYLSLLTDIKIPLAMADAASQQSGVLVAPPLNFGSSPYFLDYPGTISFRLSTLVDAVEDIIRSVYGQGFRRVLILNGHGGNSGVQARLSELINELPDLEMNWFSWWESHGIEAITLKNEIKPAHANWLEAFPFTQVSEMPAESKAPPYVPSAILNAKDIREIYGDGSFGGPYQADAAIMGEIFRVAVEDIVNILKFE